MAAKRTTRARASKKANPSKAATISHVDKENQPPVANDDVPVPDVQDNPADPESMNVDKGLPAPPPAPTSTVRPKPRPVPKRVQDIAANSNNGDLDGTAGECLPFN